MKHTNFDTKNYKYMSFSNNIVLYNALPTTDIDHGFHDVKFYEAARLELLLPNLCTHKPTA